MVGNIKRTYRLAWVFVLCGVGGILLLAPRIAQAHAEYDRSDPPADAVIRQAPEAIRIWFTQELFRREGANWIEVTGPDGSQVQVEDAVVDDDDVAVALEPAGVETAMPSLLAGPY